MQNRFFITATGTNIGKTFIAAGLAQQAKELGKSVIAYKPILTGFDAAKPKASDTATILQSLGHPATPENIKHLSPWRYTAPLAPSMAARQESRPIDMAALAAWSKKAYYGKEDVMIMEAVGGIMVPLDDRHTVLDWLEATGMPALLVTGSYLGTISHTLTALAVLELGKIPVAGVIVNESEGSSVTLGATTEELKLWTRAPVISVKRRGAKEGWKGLKELAVLLT